MADSISSTGDPDVDAAFGGPTPVASTVTAVSTGDPDVDRALPQLGSVAERKISPPVKYDAALFRQRVGRDPEPTELANFAASKGVGWKGDPGANVVSPVGVIADRMLGGAVRGIAGGYRGIATLLSGGGAEQAAKNVEAITSQEGEGSPRTAAVLSSPANPLNYVDEAGQFLGDRASDIGAPPAVSTALRVAPVAAASILGLRGMKGQGTPATMAEPEAVANAPHPLQAVADSESARIRASIEAGRSRGITLPERNVSPNQEGANTIVRDELNLAPKSPITPPVLDAARQQFGAPAYDAVSKVPQVKLGSAYESDIGGVDTSLIKEGFRPPASGSISGARAVELSKYLREKASDYFQEGTVEANEKGQAHWDAAQAVEDAVERRLKATGQGQLSADWDNARTYYAKTYSVQSALDGAGNVVAPKLKTQLIKGKPLSGGLQDLATMAATNPEAFKSTPMAPTRPGIIRRSVAAAVPPLATLGGSLLGGAVGHPTTGAMLGEGAGVRIANRVLNP